MFMDHSVREKRPFQFHNIIIPACTKQLRIIYSICENNGAPRQRVEKPVAHTER